MIAHRRWHWGVLIALLGVVMAAGVALGPVALSPRELIAALGGRGTQTAVAIVTTLRAPRVVLAALVGVGLALSGTILQGTLRNPLAEPYLLGVSGGAAVGAVSATVAGVVSVLTPLAAFAGASVAVMTRTLDATSPPPRVCFSGADEGRLLAPGYATSLPGQHG